MRVHDRQGRPIRIRNGHYAYGGYRIIKRKFDWTVHRPKGDQGYEEEILGTGTTVAQCSVVIDAINNQGEQS